MPRILEQFAMHGLVPSRWHSAVTGERELQLDIQMAGMSRGEAEALAARLRRIVDVGTVLTFEKAG